MPGVFDVPVELAVGSLIGNGDLLKQLLSGFYGKAFLRLENGRLYADNAVITTDTARGTADIEVPLATGKYQIAIDAQAPGFAVQGVGVADIIATVVLKPGCRLALR